MIGEKVIWIQSGKIAEGIVTRTSRKDGGLVWVDNQHKPEDCIFMAYIYPDLSNWRKFLQDGLDLSERHKRERDERLQLEIEANNAFKRTGWK